MTGISRLLLVATLVQLTQPICADSLQKKGESGVLSATSATGPEATLDGIIQEGLVYPSGQDLAAYLGDYHAAYGRLPAAWEQHVRATEKPGMKVETLRAQFLAKVELPLSAAHLALARQQFQSRRTRLGYGLNLPESFHEDLDRAVVLKNAATLHAFFFRYLAKVNLVQETQDVSSAYRYLLVTMVRELEGYSVQDFKDIFYFQAPEASADYIDEEIFSLYRTLKEQKALEAPLLRLVDSLLAGADRSLLQRHRQVKQVLGELTFGPVAGGKGAGDPRSALAAEVKAAATGWALRQGCMRTLLFGEHLAFLYAQCLEKPESLKRLQVLQAQLRVTDKP